MNNLHYLYFIKFKNGTLKIKKRIIIKENKNAYFYFIKFNELKRISKKIAKLTKEDALIYYVERANKELRELQTKIYDIKRGIKKATLLYEKSIETEFKIVDDEEEVREDLSFIETINGNIYL